MSLGNFDATLTISAGIALLGYLINGVALAGPVKSDARRTRVSR